MPKRSRYIRALETRCSKQANLHRVRSGRPPSTPSMSASAFIPILCASHADAYRRLEEGAYVSPQPNVRGVSEATWRFVKIAMMSCTTIMGIMMLGSVFVSRFVYQDPTLQDPYKMIVRAVIALGVMGTGYIPTIADRDREEM